MKDLAVSSYGEYSAIMDKFPLVSILTTTYNRSRLLRRSISRALNQDFRNFELIVIDDCSMDDTSEVVASFNDPRVRYIRNPVNEGSKNGDRGQIQRFVYDLMRGKYFSYLCDDDYWLNRDLLSRQISAFNSHPNVSMVMGAQVSTYLEEGEEAEEIYPDTLSKFIDPVSYKAHSEKVVYLDTGISPGFATSKDFLVNFAQAPTTRLMNSGATLFSRDHFVQSGAMREDSGVLWQAGFELTLGPACYGNVVYFPEPSLIVDVRARNASFQRTQVEHFYDSLASICAAFEQPLLQRDSAVERVDLLRVRKEMVTNLSRAYLYNTLTIRQAGQLSLCSTDNINEPVTYRHVIPLLLKYGVFPDKEMRKLLKTSW